MTNVTIINKNNLYEVVREAVKDMGGFDFQGWGIDILLNQDGKIFASAPNSGNRIYQHTDKLFTVHDWSFDELDDPNPDKDEALEWWIDNNTDDYVQNFIKDGINHLDFDVEIE